MSDEQDGAGKRSSAADVRPVTQGKMLPLRFLAAPVVAVVATEVMVDLLFYALPAFAPPLGLLIRAALSVFFALVILYGLSYRPLLDYLAARGQAEQTLQEAKQELDRRVQARTAELEAERQRLFSLLDELPAIVYLKAPDYTIRFANRQFRDRFGEPTDAPCYMVVRGRTAPCERCHTASVLEGRQLIESERVFPDGTCYQLYDYPFVDVDGTELVLQLSIDVTARRRAEEKLARTNAELRSLSRRLVEVQEEERARIARELHDEAGQALTTLSVGLKLLERQARHPAALRECTTEMLGTVDGVLEGLHRLAVDLRPAALDRLGLVAALRRHCQIVGEEHALAVQLEVVGLEQRLPGEIETALYRIVQEALTNVVRHAGATRVDVILEQRNGTLVALVEDNGRGFDRDAARAEQQLGLLGMRERAEALGGTLTIETVPGHGTTLLVEVPYDGPHPAR